MTRCLSLAEFWHLAEHVTGINAATLIKASRVELADSALHAPQAGFGDTDFYPDVYDKAACSHVGLRGITRCPTATSETSRNDAILRDGRISSVIERSAIAG